MNGFEKIVESHLSAAKNAGLEGTAEFLSLLVESSNRVGKEKDRLNEALNNLALEVFYLEDKKVPSELREKLKRVVREGDLTPLLNEA